MPVRLKDVFFQRAFFEELAAALEDLLPLFDPATFLACIYDDEWERRELKERVRHTTLSLGGLLPDDYRAALDLLRRTATALKSYGFEKMIFPDFVEVYGLEDWEASLPALEEFTQVASAEFAVRPFILNDQARMLEHMLGWAGHTSEHVRRLASEGCRPRLPWAVALPALKADPSPILPILERLKLDNSESVRRSVANNLNDISKDNPQVVIDLLRRWRHQESDKIAWITRHALRTLVKSGRPDALELLGFASQPAILVKDLVVEPETIRIGEAVTFSFEIESTAQSAQQLVIDYVVHLVRAKGKWTAKVFKLTQKSLAPGERFLVRKEHSFGPISTRSYYPGIHMVEIQINGTRFARRKFTLL